MMSNINNNTLYIVLLKQTDSKAHGKPFIQGLLQSFSELQHLQMQQEPHFCTSHNTQHTANRKRKAWWVEIPVEVGETNKTNGPSWNLTWSMMVLQT